MCAWVCPKEECTNKKQMKKGDECPRCGAEVKEFGFFALKLLLEVKDKTREKFSSGFNENPTFFPREDEGFRPPSENKFSQVSHQTDSLENTSVMQKLLKSIFEQNKTIIKQNKQIVKLLKKNNGSP